MPGLSRNPNQYDSVRTWRGDAYVAQEVEHLLGKEEVTGSSPVVGSIFKLKAS